MDNNEKVLLLTVYINCQSVSTLESRFRVRFGIVLRKFWEEFLRLPSNEHMERLGCELRKPNKY